MAILGCLDGSNRIFRICIRNLARCPKKLSCWFGTTLKRFGTSAILGDFRVKMAILGGQDGSNRILRKPIRNLTRCPIKRSGLFGTTLNRFGASAVLNFQWRFWGAWTGRIARARINKVMCTGQLQVYFCGFIPL